MGPYITFPCPKDWFLPGLNLLDCDVRVVVVVVVVQYFTLLEAESEIRLSLMEFR